MSSLVRYRVTVAPHVVETVAARYEVPERQQITPAMSPDRARAHVLRLAHADAGVPGLRSLLRLGWPHTEADVYHDPNADKIERMRERDRRREQAR